MNEFIFITKIRAILWEESKRVQVSGKFLDGKFGADARTTYNRLPLAEIEGSAADWGAMFGAEDLTPCADELARYCPLHPVIVWMSPGSLHYEVLSGERRLQAARAAGLQTIACVVVERAILRGEWIESERHDIECVESVGAGAKPQVTRDSGRA